MIGSERERGTALLTVLLLVAVMATISATALDRIGLATRLAGNGSAAGQARAWLGTAEMLATTRVEDLVAANPAKLTLAGSWMATPRTIYLPDGAKVSATVHDGGNCFNLNSLVQLRDQVVLAPRAEGRRQFELLMAALQIAPAQSKRIAAGATDYIDDDDVASPDGVERSGYPQGILPANRMMADKSELRAVPGVDATSYARLAPWLCALPITDLSPLNINTLLPEQAPLLAMLGVDAGRARAALAMRPPAGLADPAAFWNLPALGGARASEIDPNQLKVKSQFFTLNATVAAGGLTLEETALIDVRSRPARILSRQWGKAD